MSDILLDVHPQELTVFARELAAAEPGGLEPFLPNRQIQGITSEQTKVSRVTTAAKARAFDAETPIGERPAAITLESLPLVPIGEKLPQKSTEILRQWLLQKSNSPLAPIVDTIYDDIANVVAGITNRVEQLRGEFLFSGVINLNENGFVREYDFGLDPSHNIGLSDITPWDQGGNAIEDLSAWVTQVQDDSGENVAGIILSKRIWNVLLASAGVPLVPGGPTVITPAGLRELFGSYDLPVPTVYDGKVGGVRNTPDTKVALVTASVGETQWGVTAEELELLGTNAVDSVTAYQPRIVASAWKSPDPVTVWSKANSTVLPVAGDINGLLVAEVLAGSTPS